jgi:hypothetical protein
MKRHIVAGLSILAVTASVGWKLSNLRETSTGLDHVELIQQSEHSHPGSTKGLAGIRIRLSPNDFDREISAPVREAPHVTIAAR